MFALIIDSYAAAYYIQSFLDRKQNKEFAQDFDDGTLLKAETFTELQVSNRVPAALSNPKKEDFSFKTPLDYVKDRKLTSIATDIEPQMMTMTNKNIA